MAAMPRKTVIVHLRVRVAWWLPYYLLIIRTLCELLDCAPDMDRVERVKRRGVRIVGVPANKLEA